jgi:hypothetical protein
MATSETFDTAEGHRVFAAECFNRSWALLDLPERSHAETAEMIDAAHASRFHWIHRSDVEPRNLAISAWQLSRVYAVAGDPARALDFGRESLDLCDRYELSPFLVGFAHEALARAFALDGDVEFARFHLTRAREEADRVGDPDDRALLVADLDEVAASLPPD